MRDAILVEECFECVFVLGKISLCTENYKFDGKLRMKYVCNNVKSTMKILKFLN